MIAPGDAFVLHTAPVEAAGAWRLPHGGAGYAFGVVLSAGPERAYVELQSRLRGEIPVALVEAGKGLLASLATEVTTA